MKKCKQAAGYALLTVLLGLVVIGLIASRFGILMRSDLMFAQNRLESVKTRETGDEVLLRVVEGLMREHAAGFWRADGSRYQLSRGGKQFKISIQDEMGLLPVSTTPGEMLTRLLRGNGVLAADAERLGPLLKSYSGNLSGWLAELEALGYLENTKIYKIKSLLSVHSAKKRPVLTNAPKEVQTLFDYTAPAPSTGFTPVGKNESSFPNGENVTLLHKGTGGRLSSEAMVRIQIQTAKDNTTLGAVDAVVRLTGPKQVPFQILALY